MSSLCEPWATGCGGGGTRPFDAPDSVSKTPSSSAVRPAAPGSSPGPGQQPLRAQGPLARGPRRSRRTRSVRGDRVLVGRRQSQAVATDLPEGALRARRGLGCRGPRRGQSRARCCRRPRRRVRERVDRQRRGRPRPRGSSGVRDRESSGFALRSCAEPGWRRFDGAWRRLTDRRTLRPAKPLGGCTSTWFHGSFAPAKLSTRTKFAR